MKNSLVVSALGALVLLSACATATPYQPAAGSARGFTDQQIETDRWSVSFGGNSLTDRQTVETYLLYRAAELTSANGYDYFRVVRRQTEADTNYVATGYDPFYPNFYLDYRFYGAHGPVFPGRLRGFRNYAYYDPFFGFPQEYREVTRYEASAEIIMGRGEKPSDPAFFSAEQVLVNLAGQIQRPAAG